MKAFTVAVVVCFFGIDAARVKPREAILAPAQSDADASIAKEWGLNAPNSWELLRNGGGGAVYKVSRSKPQMQELILKRVDITSPAKQTEYAEETGTMAKLNGAAQTLRLRDKAIVGNTWAYMLLSFIPHPDLLAYINAAIFLGWEEAAIWQSFGKAAASQISKAIKHLHSEGLGHGDLKLDNILISAVAAGVDTPVVDPNTFGPEDCKRLSNTEASWAKRDCSSKAMMRQAIADLANGKVPTSFLLFDFGKSAALDAKRENRNSFTVASVDTHMWSMTLLQLRHATENMYRQMKTLNGRYFKGEPNQATFDAILNNIDIISDTALDQELKSLLAGTDADEMFGDIMSAIPTANTAGKE